ncbi:MAG: class I SAM-dependent methyltransferase [Crenarchaeota archaeon]|nr:MAG: class I SAM-dependent methyltransferase [Thermoproteota archaeon]RDJ33466.1 MAG: class I SAM-dependent methyltransferase [Thermoproteota archaeon]RDJ36153.1 MAG: class I SAM-dependent methyltransferase [Thermoproteota archaeon]RDJ38785.1 MAG: class I SAM-dependent methyltransferase [Thermoproteota archaeon]
MSKDSEEKFSMLDLKNQSKNDIEFSKRMNEFFSSSLGTNMDKLRNFPKFVPRQSLSLFLAKNSIFKNILNIHGNIIECGVFLGGGLMTWAQLSSIYEPINHTRKIIGFDSFTGFEKIHPKDEVDGPEYIRPGGLATNAYDDLKKCIEIYDLNRHISHIPKIEIIKGNANETIPKFIDDNPHEVIALLYLDFDLFEPTKTAIEKFLPLMPKGAIIVFDELNQAIWPGETQAILETIGLRHLKIQRFPYTPAISYAILD